MAEAPPSPRPLPGAARNVGPRAPPAQFAAAIPAVSEQLHGGLEGRALRPVSSSGSLCHVLGFGLGHAASGRVTERWEAPLSRPQFTPMGGRAPSVLQVARSWRPEFSLLHGARGVYCPNLASCAQAVRLSLSPRVPALPQISPRDRAADGTVSLRGCPRPRAAPSRPTSPEPLHRAMQDLTPGARGASAHPGAVWLFLSLLGSSVKEAGQQEPKPWDPSIVTYPIRNRLAMEHTPALVCTTP